MGDAIGRFKNFSIALEVFSQDSVALDVVINAESVYTANKTRDKHLRGEEFFDVEKYPTIEYHSTSTNNKEFIGNLMLLSSTKPMNVPFEVLKDQEGNYFLKGAVSFNRVEYGMEDKAGSGEDVDLTFEVALQKQ